MARAKAGTYQGRIRASHRYEVVDSGLFRLAGKRFHFIGAGGVGMSGLAELVLKHGGKVSGSDEVDSAVLSKLSKSGANIRVGHDSQNVPSAADTVVISAAIKEDNCELKSARRRGIEVYKYAQMLGKVSSRYDCIAVSGTHGKSTTSGWVSYVLERAGVGPNFIIGAEVSQLGMSSGTGPSGYFVAEACEYDRSFLNLHPRICCILNIEADHLDYYNDEAEIESAFLSFACRLRAGGVLIGCGDDRRVKKIMELTRNQQSRGERDVLSFGLSEGCDVRAVNISLEDGFYSFDLLENGFFVSRVGISLPGKCNILNSLAAYSILSKCPDLSGQRNRILELLPKFKGMQRRLMYKGEFGGVDVLDDYAHHPTEIKASLEGIREAYQPNRLWCVFQPHQYSRTRFFLDDFSESFKLADVTIVPEIYFVRDTELSRQKVNAHRLVERIKAKGGDAVFIASFHGICEYLKDKVKAGDMLVTMGAGDVWKVADEYIQWLRENS